MARGHGAAGVDGLLGERAHGVEPDEAVGGDGPARDDGAHGGPAVPERLEVDAQPRGREHVPQGQHHEEHQDEHLEREQRDVHPGGEPDADDVEHRGDHDEGEDEDPLRHAGELCREVGGADEPDHHRQEEVVEHDRPADHEPDAGADAAPGVAVRGPGDGVLARHLPVAQRREDHGDGREQVAAGERAAADLREGPERRQHDERGDVGQPEQDHRPQRDRSVQVAGVLGRVAGVLGHVAGVLGRVAGVLGHDDLRGCGTTLLRTAHCAAVMLPPYSGSGISASSGRTWRQIRFSPQVPSSRTLATASRSRTSVR